MVQHGAEMLTTREVDIVGRLWGAGRRRSARRHAAVVAAAVRLLAAVAAVVAMVRA